MALVAANDDISGSTASRVTFAVTAGTAYHISVDGYQRSTGNITLNYSFIPTPPSINAAPTLTDTTVTLGSVNEDANTPSGAVGTLVSSIVSLGRNVTDANREALTGIALTNTNTTNGTWHYSTDNGANWYSLGNVSDSSARLLAGDPNTRIYFQPNPNYHGTITNAITFRAWDRTSGTNGGTANTNTNGGTTAFSTATDTASIIVNPVNDAPIITANQSFRVNENAIMGTVVGTVVATDPDSTTFSNWIITAGNLDRDRDGQAAFSINPNTGQITVNDSNDIDFESSPSFQLQVTVSDGTIRSSAQAVTVNLNDVSENTGNDNFENRIVLSGTSGSSTGSNVGSSGEFGEPVQSGTTNSVWWSWTAPSSGNVVFDTIGSSFDTFLSAYTGVTVNGLTRIIANDDIGNGNVASRVNFAATTELLIRLP